MRRYDVGGENHLRLPYNKCGCVYRLSLDYRYNAYAMAGLVCGTPSATASAMVGDMDDSCDLAGMSSPDNVMYMPGYDQLLIAEVRGGVGPCAAQDPCAACLSCCTHESMHGMACLLRLEMPPLPAPQDSDFHVNNVLWSFNPATAGPLTRVLSMPYGAEVTSPYFFPNISGFSYLVAADQHPYGSNLEFKAAEAGASGAQSPQAAPPCMPCCCCCCCCCRPPPPLDLDCQPAS